MKDLKKLREDLSSLVSALGPSDIHIPEKIKSELKHQWGKCKRLEPGLVILNADKGTKEDLSTDFDILKAVFAHELTSELMEYRKKLGEYLSRANISAAEVKELNSGSSMKNTPTWWPKVATLMKADESIGVKDQQQLTRFALDKEWSGCTKGVGRADFLHSSIVNALHGTVTHNSMLAVAAKELLELPVSDSIKAWYLDRDKASRSITKTLTDAFLQICGFCSSYAESKTPIKSNDPHCQKAIIALKEIQGYLIEQFANYRGVDFEIKYSKGAGNFPRVPWIVILPPGQSPNEGVYFSICFGRKGNGAIAGFSAAVANLNLLETVDRGSKDLVIDVNGGDPKQFYNNTFVNPLEISKDKDLASQSLTAHVAASLDLAIDFLQLQTTLPKTSPFRLSGNLDSRSTELALLTKPFTILTGASGTGKTKLAESLAKCLRNHKNISKASNIAIIPVGADWTDNRNVLGFVNHLRDTGPEGSKLPIYQSTPVLDLLLEARKQVNKNTPYFLILDEMNLSHVERYFADFLSAMEQGHGVLQLHSEGPRDGEQFTLPRYDNDPDGVPRSISYPDNLYVIGTVNIDETTYMFSPKVLDRANVIEFKVEHDGISDFLDKPGNYPEIKKADDGQAQAFHELGMQTRDRALACLPKASEGEDKKVHDHVQTHLLALFGIMQAGRFEFAYRTAKEVMNYMSVCRHLSEDKNEWDTASWKSDLDDQILQKILPKLHGSIGRVGPLLASLADYCHQGKAVDEAKVLKMILELDPDDAEFKKSFTKLQSMILTLLDEQFVSFIQ